MLPISQPSETAIRALTYLAQRRAAGYQLARELAERLGLPGPYLAKVLQPLVGRGVLESQRGRHGGYRLAREPEAVSLYQIIDSQEHLGGARPCLLGQAECSDERACPMHDFWKNASVEFLERIERTTLADLVRFCAERPESGYPFSTPGAAPGAATGAARTRR